MASPRLLSAGIRGGVLSPPANGGGDEAIWRRLGDAGLDEETVKKKDKVALIAYICKLEAEVGYVFPFLYQSLIKSSRLKIKFSPCTDSCFLFGWVSHFC